MADVKEGTATEEFSGSHPEAPVQQTVPATGIPVPGSKEDHSSGDFDQYPRSTRSK
jgi:hypothetical protein